MNKKITLTITVFLISLMIAPIAIIPNASAHTPPWQITTYAYINASPNPIGVGQQALIVVWMDTVIQGANITNGIRFHNYQLTITKPNGETETKTWPTVTDTTSSAYTQYTPDQVGTYNLTFNFPGQTYDYGTTYPENKAYQGDIYTPSNASTTLTVQQEPISKISETPLPSEYWGRPINAQNHQWSSIASNWLGGAASGDIWQKAGSAPHTSHVMWTKPYEFGGLSGDIVNQIGAVNLTDPTYYQGFSYETRFNNPMIVQGILYYLKPLSHSNTGGGFAAVDLQTGKELWSSDTLGSLTSPAPSKAQVYNVENPDQHGVVPPILWQVVGTTWNAYDAFTGKYIFNLTGVPSGTEVYGNSGEILRYILSYNTATGTGTLLQWNNSAAIVNSADVFNLPGWRPVGTSINASGTPAVHGSGYDFNVTITANLTSNAAPTIVAALPGDLILGRSSNVGLSSLPNPNPNPWTMWALNLNASKGPIGSLLWRKDYPAPPGNITRMLAWQPIDPVTRAWTMTDFETGQRLAYNLDDGNLRWGPIGDQPGFQYYSSREGLPAYGNLYITGYGGIVYAYSMKDGSLLWTYGNGGIGNSTNSGDETPWGHYPTHAAAFADGLIFTMSGEHSPNTPLYKGYRARALDAFTGQEIWTLLDWSASGLGTSVAPVAIADGYMTFVNAYDGQIYSVGKGPSAITVTAQNNAAVGGSLLVTGTITDVSAGTKQDEQAARFPAGVPAVSDESMSDWMAYVYQQQPRPSSVTGLTVTLTAIDANGNSQNIGTATSDATGTFHATVKPEIEGPYTIIATFTGSNGYYPSSGQSTVNVAAAAQPTPTPTTATNTSMTDTYVLAIGVAIIAVIIAIGAIIISMLRRRP